MAILKTKNLPNGLSGNYWRIISISVDVDTLATNLELGLFVDETSSSAGKKPLLRNKVYTFTFTTEEFLSGNILAIGYQKIIDKANTLIPQPFAIGEPQQIYYDPDLSQGENV